MLKKYKVYLFIYISRPALLISTAPKTLKSNLIKICICDVDYIYKIFVLYPVVTYRINVLNKSIGTNHLRVECADSDRPKMSASLASLEDSNL